MSVVATSVFLLFALIFLGFFIGKRGVVQKSSIPDLSNLVLMVTMPVTVFCSIVDQQGNTGASPYWQIIVGVFILHACSVLLSLVLVRAFRIPDREQGVWLFSCMNSNNGFMGLPLALSVFGSEGMFLMALGNVISNLIMFSFGIRLLTWHYNIREKLNFRKMFVNNINIAVVVGFVFLLGNIPVPDLADQLLTYLSNITSGLAMLVVGLSLSRLEIREVFRDRRMFLLPVLRLLVIPLLVITVLRILPFELDPLTRSILILTSALPSASAQSMITEQYHTNTSAAARAVFLTTLFSVVTVPLIMTIGL
ncbi:MAG: AEC family transporter [Lachnospiraceae bacterium]|nr:AEC family transporter [Lachnospiraceae bacterium]